MMKSQQPIPPKNLMLEPCLCWNQEVIRKPINKKQHHLIQIYKKNKTLKWCLFHDCIGSWLHCGYHLTTSIVAPALLSLPYALSMLGWLAGVACLTIGALVTFYSYNLLSLVLEHHAQLGHRQLRFRDMAKDILGEQVNHAVYGWACDLDLDDGVFCYRTRMGQILCGSNPVWCMLWCCYCLYSSWWAEPQGWFSVILPIV